MEERSVTSVKKEKIMIVDTTLIFSYNEDVVLFNFSSPCTLLYPFVGYMLSEVGQKDRESTFVKDCVSSKSFNFPWLSHAGRKTYLAQKLEEKTVHGFFTCAENLIVLGNTGAKAYNIVGLIFVLSQKEQICSLFMNI